MPASGHVKLDPHNLSKYEVYIESRSVNRLLVRGSRVLWNKTDVKGQVPTWNHEAV
jgi:hypothetical protein